MTMILIKAQSRCGQGDGLSLEQTLKRCQTR